MTIWKKLRWRTDLVVEKLCGQHPHFPWSLTWRIITTPRPVGKDSEVRLLERDTSAGMVLVQVGDHCYWYPADASPAPLGVIHSEVFAPDHDHFYECRGASLRPDDVALD